MAISWDTQITNVNTSSNRANVSFKRTDSEVPGDVFTRNYNQAVLSTTAERLALLDAVWAEWQAEIAKRSAITTFVDNLEQTANSNLDAREI